MFRDSIWLGSNRIDGGITVWGEPLSTYSDQLPGLFYRLITRDDDVANIYRFEKAPKGFRDQSARNARTSSYRARDNERTSTFFSLSHMENAMPKMESGKELSIIVGSGNNLRTDSSARIHTIPYTPQVNEINQQTKIIVDEKDEEQLDSNILVLLKPPTLTQFKPRTRTTRLSGPKISLRQVGVANNSSITLASSHSGGLPPDMKGSKGVFSVRPVRTSFFSRFILWGFMFALQVLTVLLCPFVAVLAFLFLTLWLVLGMFFFYTKVTECSFVFAFHIFFLLKNQRGGNREEGMKSREEGIEVVASDTPVFDLVSSVIEIQT